MFGSLGGPEIVLIVVLALLLFGPRRLPQIARTIGRTMGEFRKASQDFRSNLEREIELEEVKEAKDTISTAARDIAGETPPSPPANAESKEKS